MKNHILCLVFLILLQDVNCKTSEDILYSTENVSISMKDGRRITADFFLPEKRTEAFFLVLNGLGNHRTSSYPVCQFLAYENFASCTFSYSGHDDSDGEYCLSQYLEDITDIRNYAISYLKAKKIDCVPFFLLGGSMGGMLAMHYALRNRDIDGLIMIAAPLSFSSVYKNSIVYRNLYRFDRFPAPDLLKNIIIKIALDTYNHHNKSSLEPQAFRQLKLLENRRELVEKRADLYFDLNSRGILSSSISSLRIRNGSTFISESLYDLPCEGKYLKCPLFVITGKNDLLLGFDVQKNVEQYESELSKMARFHEIEFLQIDTAGHCGDDYFKPSVIRAILRFTKKNLSEGT